MRAALMMVAVWPNRAIMRTTLTRVHLTRFMVCGVVQVHCMPTFLLARFADPPLSCARSLSLSLSLLHHPHRLLSFH
jgi:hypothetical protein